MKVFFDKGEQKKDSPNHRMREIAWMGNNRFNLIFYIMQSSDLNCYAR